MVYGPGLSGWALPTMTGHILAMFFPSLLSWPWAWECPFLLAPSAKANCIPGSHVPVDTLLSCRVLFCENCQKGSFWAVERLTLENQFMSVAATAGAQQVPLCLRLNDLIHHSGLMAQPASWVIHSVVSTLLLLGVFSTAHH